MGGSVSGPSRVGRLILWLGLLWLLVCTIFGEMYLPDLLPVGIVADGARLALIVVALGVFYGVLLPLSTRL